MTDSLKRRGETMGETKRGGLWRRIERCEQAAGVGQDESEYCKCPVARKNCIHMTWAPPIGEPYPEPEICARCGKPHKDIRLVWGETQEAEQDGE